MFAPRCRGQIAARSNGRLVLQGTASCLPSGTPWTRIHTCTCIHNTSILLIARDFGSRKKLSGSRLSSVRKFASVRVYRALPSKVTRGMRFRNTPGEMYRTSDAPTSSSCLNELMGLINVRISPYHYVQVCSYIISWWKISHVSYRNSAIFQKGEFLKDFYI